MLYIINAYQQGKILKLLYIDFQMIRIPSLISSSIFKLISLSHFIMYTNLLLSITYKLASPDLLHKVTISTGKFYEQNYLNSKWLIYSKIFCKRNDHTILHQIIRFAIKIIQIPYHLYYDAGDFISSLQMVFQPIL
ncbi:unnamed protein product [Paramecium octaurelia]|uniref:Uncharacterized protein n=1 Tax=Paramecium octaurelia TaxID=43137 RepID=A0A8S1W8V2_PAROT|nr:unnamed protein product [Paramecium octaurelia]